MVKTILLVDKEPLFMEEVRKYFLTHGFRVLCARSQAEAERILESTKPDVMVTEIMLERQDGGFCLAWKAKKIYPDLPVLIVSAVTWHTGLYFGLSSDEDKNWIKADFFMDKPLRVEELDAVIKTLLNPAKTA
ncbi:MAG: response regulator [Planctomycetes bacterium]|nr:response regulator [Planctomycetota bacterium]